MTSSSRLIKSVLGVIPARYGSTRFPGKPLVKIHGRPMIQWVYEAAQKVLPKVVVATDDFRIQDAVKSFGGNVMMTPNECASGTDRMAFVARKIWAHYYVNIQGDEPLIDKETILSVVRLARQTKSIGTAGTDLKPEMLNNPNVVKVVVGEKKQALYFSRQMIPAGLSDGQHCSQTLKHVGLYVYPKRILQKFVGLKQPEIETVEKLEQLRALHHGVPLYVAKTNYDSIGVDTPDDVKKVEAFLKN